jgi:hypothetical protein
LQTVCAVELLGVIMSKRFSLLAAGVAAVAGLCATQAQAVTLLAPFASYTMKGTKTTIDWTKSGLKGGSIFSTAPGGSVAGSPAVTFNFLDTSQYLDHLQAKFTLTGSETGQAATGSVDQGNILGTFAFLYTGPTQTFMGHTYTQNKTNLLSGVYTLAHISGKGSSGSFHDSTDVGTVTFSSDIITSLPYAAVRDFSFSLSSIAKPGLSYVAGQSLKNFKAASSGVFSAAYVPEPATWAMMITGFGLLGLAARRRRALALA